MSLSVLMTWRPRNPDRERTFPYIFNHYRQTFPDAQFILCDDPNPNFNRGRALIEGVREAAGETLLFADADCWISPEALHRGVQLAPQVASFVVPFFTVNYLDKVATELVLQGVSPDSPDLIENYERQWLKPTTGICNIVQKDRYLSSGGFDPRFDGWGFEDSAWGMAMETFYGEIHYDHVPAYHLYHQTLYNPRSELYKKGLALCKQYERCRYDQTKMRALVRKFSPQ